MKVAIFSTQPYDKRSMEKANESFKHELVFFPATLDQATVKLAAGFPAVCAFVNDDMGTAVMNTLAENGTKLIALRAAGFNNVDLQAAKAKGVTVLRVPAYSPYAVAEFTVGLLLALNRKIYRAYNRIREDNFALEGLMGRDLHGKTVGIVGTGRIGGLVAKTFKLGFGCEVLAYDIYKSPEMEKMGVKYTGIDELLAKSDVVCLHCALTTESHHLIDAKRLATVKPGMLLVNAARGAIVDTQAVIDALKSGKLGGLAMDVYEEEGALFFKDRSDDVIKDDVFQHLLTFPNVLITGHQAFFTEEALAAIAETTLQNITDFAAGHPKAPNLVELAPANGASPDSKAKKPELAAAVAHK